MNLLHFIHSYAPIYGGTTTRLMNLFSNDGNKHTMVVPYLGSQYVPRDIHDLNHEDSYDNIFVKRVPLSIYGHVQVPFLEYTSKINNWKKNARQLLDGAKDSNFDMVYGHLAPMEFALAAKQFSVDKEIPLILEFHGGPIRDTLYTSSNYIKRLYNSFGNSLIINKERDILTHSSHVVVQTKSVKERVIKEYRLPPHKVQIIYNGVDPDTFSPKKYAGKGKSLRKQNRIDSEIVFSYFGFLDDNNGIEFFLNALNKLPDNIKKKTKVMIIGRGPYANLVREFAANHSCLDYLGLVDYEKIPLYYSVSDVFVIPRPSNLLTENLVPMKLLEAMAMEKIVLVSNVAAMTEIVIHGSNGVVFKQGDVYDFQRKFIDIIENINAYKQLGRYARQSVIKNFTWEIARSKLSRAYSETVKLIRLN